jgi:hypothetical protein
VDQFVDAVFNRYWLGAAVFFIAVLVLTLVSRNPIPPPGTPWPERRRRRARPRVLRPGQAYRYGDDVHRADEVIEIVDAELITDENIYGELRSISKQLHPSGHPTPQPPQLSPRRRRP